MYPWWDIFKEKDIPLLLFFFNVTLKMLYIYLMEQSLN